MQTPISLSSSRHVKRGHRLSPGRLANRGKPGPEDLVSLAIALAGHALSDPEDQAGWLARRGNPALRARILGLYLCHVVYGHSITRLAAVVGMHRSTVSRGCAKVEDLRDRAAFDRLVEGLEQRLAAHLCATEDRIHG